MAEPLRDLRAKVHPQTWCVIHCVEHAAELEQRRGLR